jgi:hypothetical protein
MREHTLCVDVNDGGVAGHQSLQENPSGIGVNLACICLPISVYVVTTFMRWMIHYWWCCILLLLQDFIQIIIQYDDW